MPFFTPLYSRIPVFLLIHHVHQEVFREHLPFPLSYIARIIESKLMPLVYKKTNIITVSESSKKDIIRLGLGTDDTIKIIHPGINIDSFKKTKKTSNPSIVYLGRLKPYKNINTAILAFAQLKNKYPTLKFDIAGNGESMSELKKLTKNLGLDNQITFLGSVDEATKKTILAKSWLMVQPSSIEGWGITVIEANASSTPVIASRVNGLKDSIIDYQTGILVKNKDVNALADAINEFISNAKLRYRLSKEALIWAENFNWQTNAKNFYQYLFDSATESQYSKVTTGIETV